MPTTPRAPTAASTRAPGVPSAPRAPPPPSLPRRQLLPPVTHPGDTRHRRHPAPHGAGVADRPRQHAHPEHRRPRHPRVGNSCLPSRDTATRGTSATQRRTEQELPTTPRAPTPPARAPRASRATPPPDDPARVGNSCLLTHWPPRRVARALVRAGGRSCRRDLAAPDPRPQTPGPRPPAQGQAQARAGVRLAGRVARPPAPLGRRARPRYGYPTNQSSTTATGCRAMPPTSRDLRRRGVGAIAGCPSSGAIGMSSRGRLCCGRNTATRYST